MEIVNHRAMAEDQLTCPEVTKHKEGKCPKSIRVAEVEFSPGVTLTCDTSDGKRARPIVPHKWRPIIFKMYHNLHHPGQKRTLQKIEEKYYWQEMRKDVSSWVNTCKSCQECKTQKTIFPPLKHRPIVDDRFKDLQIDVVGPLPPSESMKYLLTVLDRRTRCKVG